MSIETMKLALEALEAIWEGGLDNYPDTAHERVMDALRQAIEQAERASKRTISYACPVCCASMIEQAKQQERVFDCPRCGHCCPSTAEQAQPVAWMHNYIDGNIIAHKPADIQRHPERWTQLYAVPPQRQPMTDEEIEDLYFDGFSISKLKQFARAIEAAHGIKGEA